MAFCELNWKSDVLGKETTTWVLLPNGGKGPFATFYLLHGLSDNQTIWLRRTRLEQYVENLPLIVVMPDGGRGFYTNHRLGPAWADHIALELSAMIERTFPAKPSGDARCIGGLSMGGYGAMRLGLGFPGHYASVNSHSGALAGPSAVRLPKGEFANMIGAKYAGSRSDLVHLARKAKAAGKLPKIRIDCGHDDFLIEANRTFHRDLNRLKIDHEYEEFPGEHNWQFWDEHVKQAIAFHAKHLGIAAG